MSENEKIVQNAFNKFLEVFIIGKKSLIVEDKECESIKKEDISNCQTFLENNVCKKSNNEITSYGTIEDLKKALEKQKNENSSTWQKYVILLWHCYWIMYLMNGTSKNFLGNINGLTVREKYPEGENGIPLFVDNEIAATDMAYSSGTIKAFVNILELFTNLVNIENIASIKVEEIKSQILADKKLADNRAKNVLLYLCNPNNFPCIISQRHQNAVYDTLGKFYEEQNEDNVFKKERHVKVIERGVIDDFGCTNLYDDKIKPFWGDLSTNLSADKGDKLPKDTLLKYKKAIVLYGPPGTSKSYEARSLAKHLIRLEFLKELKEKINKNKKGQQELQRYKETFGKFQIDFYDIFNEEKENITQTNSYQGIPHIHRLQLHPGYTYDDFIVGRTIKGNGVQIQKGYLMRLIEDINRDRTSNTPYAKLPHILILDEINRVDISRVFGELFTAMEKDYRKTGVDLPVMENEDRQSWKLKVPEDLYIIGTMNMIDFSLEQVDFALRRRFAWIESNYDNDRLKDIIEEKSKKLPNFDSKEISPFATACTKLNEKISDEPSLGPAYQIGHAFFAEIVDIYEKIISEGKQEPWEVAKKVLWSISVRPTLDAYCGSMDTEQKKQFIETTCKDAFLAPAKKKENSTKGKQEG